MLSAIDIVSGYGERTVLKGVTADFSLGTVTAIIGANGAGKSTLLGALAGDTATTTGQVLLNGRVINSFKAADLAAKRAVLPQHFPLNFPFTVFEIVRLGVRDQSDTKASCDLVQSVLAEVDLEGFGPRLYQLLSGGEQQRVQFARVLAQLHGIGHCEPGRYMLLDEPTSGLDLKHQYASLDIARRFAANGGAVIAVLHDLNLAAAYADRLLVLQSGQIIAHDVPNAVLQPAILKQAFDTSPLFGVAHSGASYILPPRMSTK